jgi:hypothetical protein
MSSPTRQLAPLDTNRRRHSRRYFPSLARVRDLDVAGHASGAGRLCASDVAPPKGILIMPFETLWTRARAGSLEIGDPAPDFSLIKLDKSSNLRLSEINVRQPVATLYLTTLPAGGSRPQPALRCVSKIRWRFWS